MKELKENPIFLRLIDQAIDEDLGEKGDITSKAVISSSTACKATITTKSAGVVAGIEISEAIFQRIDSNLEFSAHLLDGDMVGVGESIADIEGSMLSILAGERTSLNFLSYLSGIATITKKFVREIEGTKAKIFDTRKTHPGLRVFEKYAVRVGGGSNHRSGLFDQVLIKDNHLMAVDSLKIAIESGKNLSVIEIEVEDLSQLREALDANPDIIMLDNMDIEMIEEAVGMVGGRVLLEVSGGVSLENVRKLALSGVDRIAVGSITMAAMPLDIALDVVEVREYGR